MEVCDTSSNDLNIVPRRPLKMTEKTTRGAI